jgi:ubiquinone/menaquinone biosynthesis C-methylase UbiE
MPNPFDDPVLAKGYERWYAEEGYRADRLEKRLLTRSLAGFRQPKTVLEVGCGTGHFTRWLAAQGLEAVGLDVSPVMLAEALGRNGVQYVVGEASALPFADRCFDIVAFITTLEFVTDPQRSLNEAVRVAQRGLLLGVLNRNSLLELKRRVSARPPWDAARFYSPRELAQLVRSSAGNRLGAIRWRTTLWPVPCLDSVVLPWGGFIGMSVTLGST